MSSPEKSNAGLVNPPLAQTRMVRIKANHPIRIMDGANETIIQPGSTAEVTEEEAKEFCDKSFDIGHREAFGNIESRSAKTTVVVRAERVK